MKRLTKIFVNLLAVLLIGTACFGTAGCVEKITTLDVKVQVYNYTAEEMQEVTLKVNLYGHLAKKTVDRVISYAKKGFYNNNVFYKMNGTTSQIGSTNQIMLGDIVDDDGVAMTKNIFPTIKGEFERNGVAGSNLVNEKGVIGLWRSWYENSNYNTNETSMDSGKATWYIPTSTISSYNDWFCVFAKIDLEDEETANALDLITKAFDETTEKYTVYYTGEYDESKANENHGLKGNVVKSVDFDESDYFKAEGAQLVCYNKQEISVAMHDGEVAAKILSISVGK